MKMTITDIHEVFEDGDLLVGDLALPLQPGKRISIQIQIQIQIQTKCKYKYKHKYKLFMKC